MNKDTLPTTAEELAALIDERVHAILDKDVWPLLHALKEQEGAK